MLLATWTIREWLSAIVLLSLCILPVVLMWRFFVKGADEKKSS